MRLNLGVHVSIQGGIHLAPLRAHQLGCESIQIFTKSNLQWRAVPLRAAEVTAFRARCRAWHLYPRVGHTSYLLNLASPDDLLWRRSVDSFVTEVTRAEHLGLDALVTHPGAHLGAGETEGLHRVRAGLREVLERSTDSHIVLCLEITAGAGTTLGGRFEHLSAILQGLEPATRLGVCLDTAHLHAAGYDLRTKSAYRQTLAEFDRVIGLNRLRVLHLNDSQAVLGSHLDRHEHIGHGTLGLQPFKRLLREEHFRTLPKILETPKGRKGRIDWDFINLRLLRQLAGEVKRASTEDQVRNGSTVFF